MTLTVSRKCYILPDPENGWSKHDFLVALNVPRGVHKKTKNLLTRIGIHDLLFCDNFFHDFLEFFREAPF